MYLRIILDLYSGLVVEFATGSAPRQTGSATATEWIPVILQSDRGCQFTSKVCQYFLATCHIMCGKSVVGSCAGNAAAESYLGAKRERVHQPQHRTRPVALTVKVPWPVVMIRMSPTLKPAKLVSAPTGLPSSD